MRELTLPTPAVPFVALGAIGVVAGGAVAALTGPTGWGDGSWVAAYLVLVVGVALIVLGSAQAVVSSPTRRDMAVELVGYLAGSALVLAGTLIDEPVVVTIGSVALAATLAVLFAVGRRGRASAPRSWVAIVYVGMLAVLIVSIPVGVALSWLRH